MRFVAAAALFAGLCIFYVSLNVNCPPCVSCAPRAPCPVLEHKSPIQVSCPTLPNCTTQSVKHDNEKPSTRHAYVLYATSDIYMCSALINLRRIRRFGASRHNDVVVIIPEDYQPSNTLSVASAAGNFTVIRVAPTVKLSDSTYHDVLTKLRVFELEQYDRIVYIDADSLVMRSMDDLFQLPITPLAASRAYWLQHMTITTIMMVIQPSKAGFECLWKRQELKPRHADMDLIDEEFGETAMLLPTHMGVLNSHWAENWHGPFKQSLEDLYNMVCCQSCVLCY